MNIQQCCALYENNNGFPRLLTPRELSRSVVSNVLRRRPQSSCVCVHICLATWILAPQWTHLLYCAVLYFFHFQRSRIFPFFHMQIVKRFVVLHLQNWSCLTNTFFELCECVTAYISNYTSSCKISARYVHHRLSSILIFCFVCSRCFVLDLGRADEVLFIWLMVVFLSIWWIFLKIFFSDSTNVLLLLICHNALR